jgi:hypothetical protein
MINAPTFAEGLHTRLSVRAEVLSDLSVLGNEKDRLFDKSCVNEIIELSIFDYWTESVLEISEQLWSPKPREIEEVDIPTIAAGLTIQRLMTGAFPDINNQKAKNLGGGRPAWFNGRDDAHEVITDVEEKFIKRLQSLHKDGLSADEGKSIVGSLGTALFPVTGRPKVGIKQERKPGQIGFCFPEITIYLQNGPVAVRKETVRSSSVNEYQFTQDQLTTQKLGVNLVGNYQNLTKPIKESATSIVERSVANNYRLSFDELYVLITAANAKVIKMIPGANFQLITPARALHGQEEISLTAIRKAALAAGIKHQISRTI